MIQNSYENHFLNQQYNKIDENYFLQDYYKSIAMFGISGLCLGMYFFSSKKQIVVNKIYKNKYEKELYLPEGISFVKTNPGLQNFGNTCFANSLIQALSSCTYFIEYLLKNKQNFQLPIGLKVFNNLFLHLILSISSYEINDILNALDKFILYLEQEENFNFTDQQDSHEFFQVISKKFHEIQEFKENQKNSLAFLGNYQKKVKFPFEGVISIHKKCRQCNQNSLTKIENFYELNLNILDEKQLPTSTFDRLYQYRFQEQIIDEIYCSNCSLNFFRDKMNKENQKKLENFLLNQSSTQIYDIDELEFKKKHRIISSFTKIKTSQIYYESIQKFPQILSVFINRLGYDRYGTPFKSQKQITYPLEFIKKNQKYKLKSIVTHLGGAYGGHYVSVNKAWTPNIDLNMINLITPQDQKFQSLNWNYTSDKKTCSLTDEQFSQYNFNPYMMFYELNNQLIFYYKCLKKIGKNKLFPLLLFQDLLLEPLINSSHILLIQSRQEFKLIKSNINHCKIFKKLELLILLKIFIKKKVIEDFIKVLVLHVYLEHQHHVYSLVVMNHQNMNQIKMDIQKIKCQQIFYQVLEQNVLVVYYGYQQMQQKKDYKYRMN